MEIKSKFRSAVATKNILGFGLAAVILMACTANSFENGELNYKSNAFFFFCFVLFLSACGIFFLVLESEITVTEKGILNKTVVFGKETFLAYAEISKIEMELERSSIKGSAISDGYPVWSVVFKNRSRLVISSGTYENYEELVNAIKLGYQKCLAAEPVDSGSALAP